MRSFDAACNLPLRRATIFREKPMLTRKTDSPLQRALRPTALVLSASLLAPTFLAGCGSSAPPAPRDATPGEMSRINQSAQTSQGMSTRKKVAILAGAALLYYLYKRNKAQNQAPQNVQYYLSKSTGRVYYRDPKTKQAIWVTPPPESVRPMTIPESEAMEYRDFAGYNNQSNGRQLRDVFETR
jgi:hypothetical protein